MQKRPSKLRKLHTRERQRVRRKEAEAKRLAGLAAMCRDVGRPATRFTSRLRGMTSPIILARRRCAEVTDAVADAGDAVDGPHGDAIASALLSQHTSYVPSYGRYHEKPQAESAKRAEARDRVRRFKRKLRALPRAERDAVYDELVAAAMPAAEAAAATLDELREVLDALRPGETQSVAGRQQLRQRRDLLRADLEAVGLL